RPPRPRALVPILGRVLVRELALPEVGEDGRVRRLLVAPDVGLAFLPAARRELPLGLRGQALAGPPGVGGGVVPGDVDDGVVLLPLDAAARPLRVTPAGARRPLPPLPVGVGAAGGD